MNSFKLKNVILILFTIIMSIIIFSGCSNNVKVEKEESVSKEVSFINISAEDAKKRLDNEDGIILLDVRTVEEYQSGHIKDSILIPVDLLEQEAEEKLTDKNAPIFIYCRSGNRSVTAAKIFINKGYTNVYNLGGIKDWPYEIVRE